MRMVAKQVMVVDDQEDIVTVLTQMLKRQGYQVHAFTKPLEALSHAEECKECKVVVSDVRMPEMNGFQLVRALRTFRPDMKIVLMTALEISAKEWQLALPSTKVDQFLTKPFSVDTLVQAIEEATIVLNQS